MAVDGLQFIGPEPGAWLQERMTTFGGAVGEVTPPSYPAYARVLHRVDATGRAIRWSDVCAATGATAHPLMQWSRISRRWNGPDNSAPSGGRGRSSERDPDAGNLDPLSMAALYRVLTTVTPESEVFHAFWIGWGGLHPGLIAQFTTDGPIGPPESQLPFPSHVVDGPTLTLPGRDYLVFTGSLDPALFTASARSTFWPQSPSLSWPADHRWCIATEIDFDSTIVAGSNDLIAAVLTDPALEAWPVTAPDSLQDNADLINTD